MNSIEILLLLAFLKMKDKLYFHFKSANNYPGKNKNESVTNPIDYTQLSLIPNWRSQLSNFYFSPFKLNNKTYNTVEHYFQSEKIKLVDPKIAEKFTVESGNEIGLGDGIIARKARKILLLNKDQLKEWDEKKKQIMEDAQFNKFNQNIELKKTLLNTKNAELWHNAPRIKTERMTSLENIREKFQELK